MLNSFTLLGSASGRNSGDAALISAIADSIDRCCGVALKYEVPSTRPSYISTNYSSNIKPVSLMPWNFCIRMLGLPAYRSIMRTDMTLIFDAILFDRELYNPLFNFMSSLFILLPLAKKHGKKMALYDAGIGPISTSAGQKMLVKICELMDFIKVRDEPSYQILREAGVEHKRIIIAADAALNAPSSDDTRIHQIFMSKGVSPDKPIVAVNINKYIDTWAQTGTKSIGKERFLKEVSTALNRIMTEIEAQYVFITTQHADVDITKELIQQLKFSRNVKLFSSVEFNHYDMKGILRNVTLLFGMRVHSMILASAELTPITGLAYQPKVYHYYKTLGLEEFCMDFKDFSASTLYELITKAWSKRSEIKEHLVQRIPYLKLQALKPAIVISEMRKGKDVEEAISCVSSDNLIRYSQEHSLLIERLSLLFKRFANCLHFFC